MTAGTMRTAARRRAPALALVPAVLVLLACSPADPEPTPGPNLPPTQQPSTSGSSASPGPTTDPQDVPSSTASASRAPDPAAPKTFTQAERPGQSGTGQVDVDATTRDRARWDDDVTLRVTRVTSSTASGRGPGSLNGAPLSTLALTVTNGSTRTLDLSRVVLSMPYGSGSRRLAQQVYTDRSQDFSGTVAKDATAEATYAFSIPTKQRSTADLVVDLDGRHALATLDEVAR